MIEVAVRFRCDDCGIAIEMPQILPQFPMKATFSVGPELVPQGWTVAAKSIHCPAHAPKLVEVASVAPAAADLRRMIVNGRG